jgi:hypothetical protein
MPDKQPPGDDFPDAYAGANVPSRRAAAPSSKDFNSEPAGPGWCVLHEGDEKGHVFMTP